MNKKMKIVLTIIVIILIIIIALLASRNISKVIKQQSLAMGEKQLDKGIYYHVYKYNWDTKEGMMVVRVVDPDSGIETITCPDGTIINSYGKRQVSIDCNIELNNNYPFVATTATGDIIQKEININETSLQDLIKLQYSEEQTKLTINLDYDEYKNKFYKFDPNGNWAEYQGEFTILAEDAVHQGGYNEETKTTTIYLKGSDDLGNEVTIQQKIYIIAQMPKVNLIFRNTEQGTNINDMKQKIKDELAKNNISAGLMEVALGGEEVVSSNADDAQTIFNTWGRVGWKGQWSYNASSKSIINAENTDNYTGFYYSKKMDYNEIELEYNNTTTDGDDDMMGCMIRFNVNSNGTVTTYLFALDRHDTVGKGISNGAYNGLLKITGKSFAHGNVQVLQRINKVWARNQWINYKITAKDNNIKVYMNGELVVNYTDNSNPILSGSYGFFSYSQANSMYKDIKGRGLKYYSLSEAIDITNWDKDTNCIININNDSEEGLTEEVASKLNEKNIHYIGVTTEEHKQEVNNFLPQVNNRGSYINSADYEQTIKDIVEYVKSII